MLFAGVWFFFSSFIFNFITLNYLIGGFGVSFECFGVDCLRVDFGCFFWGWILGVSLIPWRFGDG